MTNSKMTRRALLTSLMALVLCFAMLTGTTFAWFTDQETSGNNKIIAGNLDVALYHTNDKVTNETKVTSGTMLFDSIDLWEPGAVVYENLKVVNEGNLALKFQLSVNFEDGGLADALKVAVVEPIAAGTARADVIAAANGKWKPIKTFSTEVVNLINTNDFKEYGVVIYWEPSDADNDFNANNGSTESYELKLGVTVIATQLENEEDAFGKDYDEPAVYPGSSEKAPIGGETIVLETTGENVSQVTLSPEFLGTLNASVTDVSISSLPPAVNDNNGEVSVVYSRFEIVDQNGDAIDFEGNNVVIPVKLYVGTAYAGKNATVAHDGVVVANTTVDAEGYVSYNTTHFCEIAVVLADEAPKDGIMDSKNEEVAEEDLTKLIQVRVGNHYYTVSQGMANSWKTLSNAEQVVADIYVPEDLIAYAMMNNNGDLTMNSGVHSDLTLKNDLDCKDCDWVPIGRFFTNIHGNGKKISNLNDSLFGCVYDCHLDNVTIENVNASGSASGVLGKELAGDIYFTNVTIAGTNTVTYVDDNATNWPEGGTGVGAICGISLIGCSGVGQFDVTVTGTIEVNYNDIVFGNTTNLENLGVSKELGINLYKKNTNVTVTVVDGGKITTNGIAHWYNKPVAEGFVQDSLNEKYYAITSAEGLANFSTYVNDGNPMKGSTVTLFCDVDLKNEAWTPIGAGDVNGTWVCFNGSFEGRGHTVSNFKVTKSGGWNGLFGLVGRGANANVTISNLTVENVVIEDTNRMTGAIVGQIYGNIENCHVKNVTITAVPNAVGDSYDNGDKIGGIVGWQGDNGNNHYIKNSTATNVTLKAYRDVGGITGYIGSSSIVENCAVDTVNITVDQATNYYGAKDSNAGAIVGRIYKEPVTVQNNTESNVNIIAPVFVTTGAELNAAISNGVKHIALVNDVTVTDSLNMSNSYSLDLNGKTLYLSTTATSYVFKSSTIEISNGTVDISKAVVPNNIIHFANGLAGHADGNGAQGNSLTFKDVKLYGDGFSSYSVFTIRDGADGKENFLNFIDSTVELKNEARTDGGFIKHPGSKTNYAFVNITNTKIDCENVTRLFLYGVYNIKDSEISFVDTKGESNGMRQGEFIIDNSKVTISGGDKGISPRHADTVIKNGSEVTISNVTGNDVIFEYDFDIVVDGTSTFTYGSVSGTAGGQIIK